MEKVIDRVTRLIRELGMNDKTFSEKAGVSIGNFAYVRSKGTDLSIENIRRIIQAFPIFSHCFIFLKSLPELSRLNVF